MKITGKASKILLCSILSVGMASSALAATDQDELIRHIRANLSSVVLPEMPTQAAKLVTEASKSEKLSTAIAVTQQAIRINSALSITIVSEISKAEPKVAAEVALEAAKMQPNYLVPITKAAIDAAPSQTERIVFALCREYPAKFDMVMASAANAAPNMQRQVWDGATQALPGVKSIVERRGIRFAAQEIVLINVTVLNLTLAEVNAAAKAISDALGTTGAGQKIVSFQQVAQDILNGNIDISSSSSISSTVSTRYTSNLIAAGKTQQEADATTSATGEATNSDPKFVQASQDADQSSRLVTGAQTFKVTGERLYANP